MRQVLGLLLVFGLGILVGNFFQPQAKYALLGSFLQIQDTVSLQMPRGSRTQFLQPDVSTATPSLATPSLAVQQALTMPPPPPAHAEERPTQLRVDGEFLKRDGREVILELPPVLDCDPMKHLLVINLEGDRGKARREHVKKEFENANLTGRFLFWSAANALTDQRLANETGKKKCPCDSKLSNSLSHREIYEMMLYERWPCATIFEDDVRLAPNFSLRVAETVGSIPPFDVILWGHCPGGSKPRTFHKDAGQSPTTLSYGWPGSCLHAYTVSLQGAFTLTQAATPVRVPADGVMDGMHHWGNRVRPHIDKARGKFTGSYWYASPMIAIQGDEADKMEGGS
ncbi:unnamed protein product [Durusdinium trenchii]|uniref:Glycosyl transferase family 25 domain-containing protein n=2 Tax=Durusdinium trenchii TaxID=1381693 RepID=A0ABP0M2D1_9DINO